MVAGDYRGKNSASCLLRIIYVFVYSVHVSYHMQDRKHTSRESEIESEG